MSYNYKSICAKSKALCLYKENKNKKKTLINCSGFKLLCGFQLRIAFKEDEATEERKRHVICVCMIWYRND